VGHEGVRVPCFHYFLSDSSRAEQLLSQSSSLLDNHNGGPIGLEIIGDPNRAA
jgi:hypothetical protein